MPLAGAWLVPKIFNRKIKTYGLSRKVEENKEVIVGKKQPYQTYWRNQAEVTGADWKCYWILKPVLCAPLTNEIGLVLWSPGRLSFVTKQVTLTCFCLSNCSMHERWNREEDEAVQWLMSCFSLRNQSSRVARALEPINLDEVFGSPGLDNWGKEGSF